MSQHNTKRAITVTMTDGTLTAAEGGIKLYVTDALSDGSKADTEENTINVTMPSGSELTTDNAKVYTGHETNVSGSKFAVKLTGGSTQRLQKIPPNMRRINPTITLKLGNHKQQWVKDGADTAQTDECHICPRPAAEGREADYLKQ